MVIVVGVLAIQGAFVEHINYFKNATKSYDQEFDFLEVRTEEELKRCDALVIPGGESTTMSLVSERTHLLVPLMQFVKSDKPIWGTCAGLIFLSKEVVNGKVNQQLLGGLDVQVKRNAFGRQLDSFETQLDFSSFIPDGDNFPTVFIRAPVISKILNSKSENDLSDNEGEVGIIISSNDFQNRAPVEILHKLPNGHIVAVRQGQILGSSFHPELSDDYRFHKWFIDEFVLKPF